MIVLLFALAMGAPTWPDIYAIEGEFALPYANITLPFIFEYAKGVGTYLNWYDGLKTEIQNVKKEMDYIIAVAKSEMKCTQVQDSGPSTTRYHLRGAPVLTNMLPDISKFSGPIKSDMCPDLMHTDCLTYTYETTVMGRDEQYTFVTQMQDGKEVPIWYAWEGYNDVFGSHFDQYVITYKQMTTDNIDPSIFTPPEICTGANVEIRGKESSLLRNMAKSPFEHEFRHFLHKHEKQYADQAEYETRIKNYHDNQAYIARRNAEGLSYKLTMNQHGDFTPEELRRKRGLNMRYVDTKNALHVWKSGMPRVNKFHPDVERTLAHTKFSDSLDWRNVSGLNAVSRVKDQAVCGSCWTFGTTGTTEGTHYLATKKMTTFSEQYLVDCAWINVTAGSNMGCDGGFAEGAFQYARDNGGIPTEAEYTQYMGINRFCEPPKTFGVKISGYVVVDSGNEMALIESLKTNGPHYVAIDASHDDFSFYASGVYSNPACKSDNDDLDHAVLAVGYGTQDGKDYWLIKNSWSTHWGMMGYVKISRDKNLCGVATDAVIPQIILN